LAVVDAEFRVVRVLHHDEVEKSFDMRFFNLVGAQLIALREEVPAPTRALLSAHAPPVVIEQKPCSFAE